MIEYSALLTQAGAYVRARRFPLGAWANQEFVPTDQLAKTPSASTGGSRFSLGISVYLGNALVRLAVLPPVRDAKSMSDFTVIASHALEQRLGLAANDWEVATDPTSRLGLVACAVRRDALRTAQRLAERLGQRLRCARVWAGAALPHLEAEPSLLDDGEATVIFMPGASERLPQLHVTLNDQASRFIASAGIEHARCIARSDESDGRLRKDFLDQLRPRD